MLANVMRKPMEEIFEEFMTGPVASDDSTGDVLGTTLACHSFDRARGCDGLCVGYASGCLTIGTTKRFPDCFRFR